MRINEAVRKSIFFLGIIDPSGAFVPYGTGFIGLWSESGIMFPYLITAKHVLEDIRGTKRPMVARVNIKDGKTQVGGVESDHWYFHPTVKKCDIAVATCLISFDTFDIRGVDLLNDHLTPEYIDANDIGCGDEVFTAGLLTSHFGETRNIPIVRMGNIAAMIEEPVDLGDEWGQQEVYLIESRSIGGLSGSPVFLNTQPYRFVKDHKTIDAAGHKRDYIMGINVGLFETKANADSLPKDRAEKREDFLERMSAGIAIVVPIQRAIEIIRDTKDFIQGRANYIRQGKDKGKFVSAS